ncbi:MAG: SGNH/GDSL hydrolase family protein [Nocardioides sp.]|uniref:SGNH/GDSL hydrolase family protein n=1 Tax=Nocardioides sp. TaxID=35761 RepID=UPI003F0B39DD
MSVTSRCASRLRRLARTAALAVPVLLLSPLLAVPAHAASPSYVALGDSYASGTGAGSYLSDGTECYRSTAAYASLIATAKGYSLNFRACSGAVVSDVVNAQLPSLSSSTSYVTISVGGNDAGFASVLTECALPGWMSSCDSKISTARTFINNTLPSRLSSLYAQIRSKAPNAKVVVVGYPRIFNGEDCNVLTFFSPAEQSSLNATGDLLNTKLAAAAAAQGFTFSNPTSRFTGHAWCSSDAWLNGLKTNITESYHPNKAGHASGFTPLISPVLTGASLTVNPSLVAKAAAQREELAAQQREWNALDKAIKPKEFVAPDLYSHRAKVAARKAGINLKKFRARHGL